MQFLEQYRQCTYIEARSCNHWSGKKVKYYRSMCVFVALVISMQCAYAYCHTWAVYLYHIIPHYLINGAIFGEKMLFSMKCVFWFYVQICVKHISC